MKPYGLKGAGADGFTCCCDPALLAEARRMCKGNPGPRRPGQTEAEYVEELEAQVAFLAAKLGTMRALPAQYVTPESEVIEARDAVIATLEDVVAWASAARRRAILKARKLGQENRALRCRLADATTNTNAE